jgi:hypothetical protein
LVQAIHSALISPSAAAWNISTAVLPGWCGTDRHAPQRGHFGAVLRVGHVAVGAEQIGQAAHLAPAHGVGLAGQREGAGAGLADLAGGQVQVDQGGVLGRAAAGLVQALAVQAERGPATSSLVALRTGKPSCARW